MSLLGVHLTLMIGPTVAVPAPLPLTEAIEQVKVTMSDTERSGFEITFATGRGGLADLVDHPLLMLPLLNDWNRVVLLVTFTVVPQVLMDGVITRREVHPGNEPGQGKIVIQGEDVSVMMDRHEVSQEHPAQPEMAIANVLIAQYAQYGLIPMVIPPVTIDPPIPIERTPVQQGTDLEYLQQMAERYGYVFYIIPGPAPMTNTAYWGPKLRPGLPQPAITVNMGGETNASLGAFQTNAHEPTRVTGQVQDRQSGQTIPVQTFGPLRPPLAALPMWLVDMANTRESQFRDSGVNAMQAYGRAQGRVEASADAVTVDGELDVGMYGGILQPRALVGVRGAGYMHDGFWNVKKVTHEIKHGSYKQSFTLAREGHGSTTPVVPV